MQLAPFLFIPKKPEFTVDLKDAHNAFCWEIMYVNINRKSDRAPLIYRCNLFLIKKIEYLGIVLPAVSCSRGMKPWLQVFYHCLEKPTDSYYMGFTTAANAFFTVSNTFQSVWLDLGIAAIFLNVWDIIGWRLQWKQINWKTDKTIHIQFFIPPVSLGIQVSYHEQMLVRRNMNCIKC